MLKNIGFFEFDWLEAVFFFFFSFFFLGMGTQNGHNVTFLESASLKKRKRIKQFYKISKKGLSIYLGRFPQFGG